MTLYVDCININCNLRGLDEQLKVSNDLPAIRPVVDDPWTIVMNATTTADKMVLILSVLCVSWSTADKRATQQSGRRMKRM